MFCTVKRLPVCDMRRLAEREQRRNGGKKPSWHQMIAVNSRLIFVFNSVPKSMPMPNPKAASKFCPQKCSLLQETQAVLEAANHCGLLYSCQWMGNRATISTGNRPEEGDDGHVSYDLVLGRQSQLQRHFANHVNSRNAWEATENEFQETEGHFRHSSSLQGQSSRGTIE